MTMPKFEPVAYMQASVEDGVDTEFPRLHKPEKYNKDWWRFDPLHTADQLTEAYEAGKRAGIPEGWVVVPKEPTGKQVRAMEDQWMCGSSMDMAKREYKAMLAAAPKGEEL